jgi:cytochrome c peroxidase
MRRLSFALLMTATVVPAQLPPVPVPKENPVTPAKAVLGKMLFWDEQLSSDNTVACGTCHQPRYGGGAHQLLRHPRGDGFGAAGIKTQITRRQPSSFLLAQHTPRLFWDGRASGTFKDPLTDKVLIHKGGALESQALEPILNDTEMAHEGRTWKDVASKLEKARSLALATDLPKDVTVTPYPRLFEAAFGDPKITPARIAFAIASYERTLVADQTPYDKFVAGDPSAITPRQVNGFHAFQRAGCGKCHTPPQFTDFSFRNIGLGPPKKDPGRQEVTGRHRDRGKFKVPSLRNVGLRVRFMHNGKFRRLRETFFHYRQIGQDDSEENLDPLLEGGLYLEQTRAVEDFLVNALTDPRVKNETYPFDRPTLRSEQKHKKKVITR